MKDKNQRIKELEERLAERDETSFHAGRVLKGETLVSWYYSKDDEKGRPVIEVRFNDTYNGYQRTFELTELQFASALFLFMVDEMPPAWEDIEKRMKDIVDTSAHGRRRGYTSMI